MSNRTTHRPRPRLILLAAGGLAALALTLPAAAQRRYPPNWPAANKGCGPEHPTADYVGLRSRHPVPTSPASLAGASDVVLLGRVTASEQARWDATLGDPVVRYTLSVYSVLKPPPPGRRLGGGPTLLISARGGMALDPQGACIFDFSDPVLEPGEYLIFARFTASMGGLVGTAWYQVERNGDLVPASGSDVAPLSHGPRFAAAIRSIATEVTAEQQRGARK